MNRIKRDVSVNYAQREMKFQLKSVVIPSSILREVAPNRRKFANKAVYNQLREGRYEKLSRSPVWCALATLRPKVARPCPSPFCGKKCQVAHRSDKTAVSAGRWWWRVGSITALPDSS